MHDSAALFVDFFTGKAYHIFSTSPSPRSEHSCKDMVSAWDRGILLDICDKFIKSGDEGPNLANLLDAVNSLFSDKDSDDYKNWSKYMEVLNETWTLINIENKDVNWPEVSLSDSSSHSV